jgi:hypothetical protein
MTGGPPDPQTNPALQLATAEVPSDDVLIGLLGTPFLAYVCNATQEEVAARVEHQTLLSVPAQEVVFAETVQAARMLAAYRRPMTVNDAPGHEPISEAFARFGEYLEDRGMSIANALRSQAGGSVEETRGDDPVKDGLRRIARDWFPVLLIPHEDDSPFGRSSFGFQVSILAWEHPGKAALLEELNRRESPLNGLFPEGQVDDLTHLCTSCPPRVGEGLFR